MYLRVYDAFGRKSTETEQKGEHLHLFHFSRLSEKLSFKMADQIYEKTLKASDIQPDKSSSEGEVLDVNASEDREVFKTNSEGVEFRTVTWQRAIIIFLKVQIATGVLGIPGAFGSLGAVGGVLSVIAWQALNTCR